MQNNYKKIMEKEDIEEFEEYIKKLYSDQYKNELKGFLKILNEIQQLNFEENSITIMKNCYKLIKHIFRKEKSLQLNKFKQNEEVKEFIKLFKNEKKNMKIYDVEMAQYIIALTELIIDYLKDTLHNLEIYS